MARYGHLQGPAQHAALYQFFKRVHGRAQAIECVLETEPGVQSEDASVSLDRFHYTFAFPYGACHGFFAPDILAGLGGFHSHDAVPVRRGGNVHHIYVGIVNQIHEMLIGPDPVRGHFHSRFQVFGIHIADGNQPCSFVFDMFPAHTAGTNDPFGQLVAGGNETVASQDTPREDGQGSQTTGCPKKISSVQAHKLS
ncbi:MAG: hypothetical protein BWX52_01883 [Bacteroidetes bacterium ADurb.Bin013]|nr:MAG: hypothetical protein BWX52_01883 [Bacteroidetes bacterium ADurb.Bin013]